MQAIKQRVRQALPKIERVSVHIVNGSRHLGLGAVLPVAVAVLSRHPFAIMSSLALLALSLLVPLAHPLLGAFAATGALWVAATLVAVAGLRCRTAEERARGLQAELLQLRFSSAARTGRTLSAIRAAGESTGGPVRGAAKE